MSDREAIGEGRARLDRRQPLDQLQAVPGPLDARFVGVEA
jgi:hypothetical protein